MSNDFDPNKPRDNPSHTWGTYVPQNYSNHRGNWKTHEKLSHVRSAIDFHRPITVYKLINDRWEKIFEVGRGHLQEGIPIHDDVCYVCKKSDGYLYTKWSPDADFEKVKVHFGSCERKLKSRKG